jgi:hypothetical protein
MPTLKEVEDIWMFQSNAFGTNIVPQNSYEDEADGMGLVDEQVSERILPVSGTSVQCTGEVYCIMKYDEQAKIMVIDLEASRALHINNKI